MKKLETIFVLIIMSSLCLGQQWKDYVIDKISIQLPKPEIDVDTLGQHVVKSLSEKAILLIQVTLNKGETEVNPKNDENLKVFYDGVQSGFVSSTKGQLLSEEFTRVHDFFIKQFKTKILIGDQNNIFESQILFLDNKLYTIHYIYNIENSDKINEERKNYFKSLRILDNLKPEDQFR